ncbi:MAG TPA: hypothetical protein VGM41_00985 [Chitinophagaceae bacterium]|jgi:hypothetical protein
MKKLLLFPLSLLLAISLFSQNNSPRDNEPYRFINQAFTLSGTLSGASVQRFIGLEAGEKIAINATRLSTKGSVIISVTDYNKGTEIFKKEFDTLKQFVTVPAKGIYVVELKNGSLLDKQVMLTVSRSSFLKVADTKAALDTTATEVLNTTVRVFSKNSPSSNKAVLKINLPPNTTYWTFWIGAGKDAKEKMDAFTASCSSVGPGYSTNPLMLYGRKVISSLPMVPPGALISYHFMDTPNSTAFTGNQQYSFYTFKSAEKITTEYSFMINHQSDLNLGITNESSNTAYDVVVRVVAFSVVKKDK